MEKFRGLIAFLIVIWAIEAVNVVTGRSLNSWFGLIPRSFGGLDGILFAPVLHGSLAHAAGNTVPLALLGAVLLITARQAAVTASALIVVLGGAAVWVFGASAIHIGASGLIFGWFGFLVARGLVERRLLPLIASAAVFLFYGTMIWGVLPGQPGVSWESHLFGAVAGVVAAFLLRSEASETV